MNQTNILNQYILSSKNNQCNILFSNIKGLITIYGEGKAGSGGAAGLCGIAGGNPSATMTFESYYKSKTTWPKIEDKDLLTFNTIKNSDEGSANGTDGIKGKDGLTGDGGWV